MSCRAALRVVSIISKARQTDQGERLSEARGKRAAGRGIVSCLHDRGSTNDNEHAGVRAWVILKATLSHRARSSLNKYQRQPPVDGPTLV